MRLVRSDFSQVIHLSEPPFSYYEYHTNEAHDSDRCYIRNNAPLAPLLPQPEPPGAFVPVDSALRYPRMSWDPGPRRLSFHWITLIFIHSQRVAKDFEAILPHTDRPLYPTSSPTLDPCGKNPTARFLQSDATRGSCSPCELWLRKALLRHART